MAGTNGKKPLTNAEAANLLRALTKIQRDKAMTRMVSERPLGTRPARQVPNKTGLSTSEKIRADKPGPVTTRRVAPTGPRASTGEKTPLGGRPNVGTAFNNPVVNPTADERTRDENAAANARAARAARDATAEREQREAETSAKIQANAAARGRAQSPKAEPMTRVVVDEQVRAGLAGKPTANKANVKAVVTARNRIEATARAARTQARVSGLEGRGGVLGGDHMGGHSDVGGGIEGNFGGGGLNEFNK